MTVANIRRRTMVLICILAVAVSATFAPRVALAKSSNISRSKAYQIARTSAHVSKSSIKKHSIVLKREDGVKVYEVKFRTSTKKYEYDVVAKTGKIVEGSMELRHVKDGNKTISKSQAKRIALDHAGIRAKQAKHLKIKADKEDGVRVYSVSFDKGRWEYEYDIVISSGKIAGWSYELD